MSDFYKTGGRYGFHSGSGRFKNAQVDNQFYVRGALIGPTTPGTIWYVDTNVGASGNGKSWDTAFKTIQEAVDASGDGTGDVIFVGPGKYQENVLIKGHEGLAIIAVVPGWATQLRASDASTKYSFTPVGGTACPGVCFAVCDRSVTISGFCCDGGGGYAGIYVGDGYRISASYDENSAGARIQNCLLRGGNEGTYGVVLDGCSDNVIIEDCVFARQANGGIYICPGGSRTVQAPIIRRNEFIACKVYGVYLYDADTTVRVLVRENTFVDFGGSAMTNPVKFQGAGYHACVGNFLACSAGISGSSTDYCSGNFEAGNTMDSPTYVSEA